MQPHGRPAPSVAATMMLPSVKTDAATFAIHPPMIAPPATAPLSPFEPLVRLARSHGAIIALLILVVFSAGQGMGSIPVLDRDESRFVQATKQMTETGDFVRIFVQDEPRNKKPIGIHWLQSATASLTTTQDVWGYRLASMLGLAAATLGAFWAGAALLGRVPAFAGAALFCLGILASTEGMIAKTDAALCGATALAMAALARLYVGQGGRWSAVGVWAALGIGILIKGPITALVVGLAALSLCSWERRWAWLKPLRDWRGPAVMALIVLPWMIAIAIATKGAFFLEALGEDLGPKIAGGDEGHFALPGYHTLLAPLLLFPAAALLVPAARIALAALRAPRNAPEQAGARFLLAWIFPIWLVFEALPTKLVHYTLPAYPALALLCGAGLLAMAARPRRERWASALLFLATGAALVALAAALSGFMPGDQLADQRRTAQAAMVGAVGMTAAMIAFLSARTPSTLLAVLIATGALAAWGLRERLLPEARELLVSDQAERALSRAAPRWREAPPGGVLIVGYRETSLVFETRTNVRLLSQEEAGAQAKPADVALVNLADPAAPTLDVTLLARGLVFVPTGPPVTGLNYSNGDPVTLQPGHIAPMPEVAAPTP